MLENAQDSKGFFIIAVPQMMMMMGNDGGEVKPGPRALLDGRVLRDHILLECFLSFNTQKHDTNKQKKQQESLFCSGFYELG